MSGDTLINDSAGSDDSSRQTSRPYPWIIGPAIDYLFVCGGAVWIVVLINYLLIGTEMPLIKDNPRHMVLLGILYVTQHVFFDAHNIATHWRLWGSPEDREAFKFYRTWLLYAAFGIFILAFVVRELIGALIFLYVVVVFWHYAMQSYGIAMIYFAKRNYILTGREKEIFRVLMYVLSAYVLVRFFTVQDVYPYNPFGAAQPFWMPIKGQAAEVVLDVCTGSLALFGLAFAFIVVRKLFVDKQLLPLPVVMLLAVIVALAFTTNSVNLLFWVYIPVFYHATQYLAVSLSYYLKERGLPDGVSPHQMAQEAWKWPALNYLGKVILIGCSLYVILPHLLSLVDLAGYEEMLALVFVVVNFHHFATDAAIWQLRDARIGKILIE